MDPTILNLLFAPLVTEMNCPAVLVSNGNEKIMNRNRS